MLAISINQIAALVFTRRSDGARVVIPRYAMPTRRRPWSPIVHEGVKVGDLRRGRGNHHVAVELPYEWRIDRVKTSDAPMRHHLLPRKEVRPCS